MGHYKTSKLSNDSPVSKFVTKKWMKYQWIDHHSVDKNIRFKTSMLKSSLCYYIDVVARHSSNNLIGT